MASSMLSGDRRWAPGRKGMTVLGKVPKPINLPSQRLENHGLDPNVEIVPKGTLTWGSRPSPTTPNAWGLSNHSSPNADGSVDSPTHFNGRPSSSGSGTRPSTAGSDHPGEHVAGAWKSNSRPSSASGLLVSSQTQLAARPQSAETRPGSSQLSRFADSAVGHSGPWGSAGITQKGPAYPGSRDFSLSSGEFPTLGSEKNPEPHYEPGSHTSIVHAPTAVSIEKNRLEISQSGTETIDIHPDKGNMNSWKSESPSNTTDASASIDSRHGNLHNMQLATNINPAQSLSNPWHGNPRNPSDGVWYRGVSSGGPYRPPSIVPSGDHLSDPFTHYPAQIPVRLDSSSHCAPRAGGHPTGYQIENGEGFHPPPPPPEPFMVSTMPIIPVRPGVYRGPVPYDPHYAPVGFGGPNVRERSVMGFAPGPPVYGQFPNQTFHQGPVRMSLRPSGPAQLSDDKSMNTRQHEFASGQYKVLLKHHNHPVGTDSHDSRDQATTSTTMSLEKNSNVEVASGQALKQKVVKDEFADYASGGTLQSNGLQDCSQEAVPTNISEKISERTGDNMINKGGSSTVSSEVNHVTTKNSKLIEKIETLNNKARVTDGRPDGPSTKDDKNKRTVNCNPANDILRNSVSSGSSFGVSSGMEPPILKSTSHGDSAISSRINTLECRSAKVPSIQSETPASTFSTSSSSDGNTKAHAEHQRRTANMQGKGDHLAKSRMDGEVNNHHTKQLPRKDSLVSSNSNNNYNGLPTEEFGSFQGHSNSLGSLHVDKPTDESYVPSSLDSVDYKAQRAKMKEIAMQRAKQLQQEEEERNREQKAKALAKLEELNRRTLFEISNKDADQKVSCHQNLQSVASHSQHPDASMDRCIGCNSSSSSETMPEKNVCGSTFYGVEVVKTSGDVRHGGPTPPMASEPDDNDSDRATLKHKNDLDMGNLENPNPLPAGPLPDIGSGKANAYDTGKNKGTKTSHLNSLKDGQYTGGLPPSADRSIAGKTGPEDSLKKNTIQYQDNSSSKKRQVGHRRKQTIPEERNLEDKVAPVDVAISEASIEVATETALDGKSASLKFIETCTPTQQRRNESSNRNKNKPEVALGSTDSTSAVQARGILQKPADICQHNQKVDDESILVSKTEKAGISQNFGEITGSSNQGLIQAAGGVVKATNHWKSNPSRRSSRNGQSRPGDKFQGNENVVWTPVRPSKGEPAGESQGSQCHAHVVGNSSTGSTDMPGNVKSKRAELQRYVPKVVKDAPQADNLQIPDCQTPVETAVADNVALYDGKEDGFTKLDSVVVRKNAENTWTNRHGRSYGSSASWRQRSSQDSSLDAASLGMNLSNQNQLEDAPSSSHVAGSSDILATPDPMSKEPVGVTNSKEQGNTSKSRRQIQKTHKVVHTDAKDSPSDVTGNFEVQSGAFDPHVTSAAAENPVERAKSQWKPKSRTISSVCIQQDTRPGGETVASQTIIQDKESPIITDQHARVPDKITGGKADDMDERRHQPRRERKEHALVNHNDKAGHSGEHYQGPPAFCPERQHGVQQMKGGKDTRYGGRFNKGQDNSHVDTGRQQFPISGDRRRQPSHYEYQRIEARNSNDQFQPVASSTRDVPSGSAATGPKFREKAQGHKKSGAHFYIPSSVSYQDDKISGRQS